MRCSRRWRNGGRLSRGFTGRSTALPIVERHQIPLGLENHKDWRVDEQVALLERYSSEYLGVSLDTGNNLSVLDDPMETVEKLAPYTVNVHFKDMAGEETETGFLLSEVPLGEGFLDMKRMVEAINAPGRTCSSPWK